MTVSDALSLPMAVAKSLPEYHVLVYFGDGVPIDVQGKVLLDMEIALRTRTGLPIEVFKERMPDDSKLRNSMTDEKRKSL